MLPTGGVAQAAVDAAAKATGGAAGAAGSVPDGMATIFMPNGVHFKDWTPTGTGKDYTLSPTLRGALKDVKGDFSVLSGFVLDNARAKGDGAGDHARSAAARS